MSSEKLMDTEVGGETSQYESIKTIDKPTAKQTGQFRDSNAEPTDLEKQKAQRGEKTAENIRYGQSISESGYGGMTTDSGAGTGGSGGEQLKGLEDRSQDARDAQKYGPGSGVGA